MLCLARISACLVLVAAAEGAAADDVRPTDASRSASTVEHPPSAAEQRQLDYAARDLDARLQRSGSLYAHPDVDAYLQTIADKLLSIDRAYDGAKANVRVVRGTSANAFALPNGAVYVSTGLLERLDNEAQIACVLGHELTHFTHQHTLKQQQSMARTTVWTRGLQLAFLIAIGAKFKDQQARDLGAQVTRFAGDLWLLTAVSGYSRDLEREADREGLRRMVEAGYDANEAVRVFEVLSAAADEQGDHVPTYFSSHPRLQDRLASYRALVSGEYANATGERRFTGAQEYRAHTSGLRLDQVEILIAAHELQSAAKLLDAEMAVSGSARAYFLQGELARHRSSTPESQRLALAAYEHAAASPDVPAEALRQEALLYRARGEHQAAVQAFKRYLMLAPGAIDAPLVHEYLEQQGADAPSSPQGDSQ